MSTPDLAAAASAVDAAEQIVTTATSHLAGSGGIDDNQVVAYDLAHAAAAVRIARAVLDYGAKGDVEARLATAFVRNATADLGEQLADREPPCGVSAVARDT